MSENTQQTEVENAETQEGDTQSDLDLTEALLVQYRQGLSADPAESFNKLGLGLFHSLDDDETYELLKSQFGHKPTDSLDYYNLGVSQVRQEKFKDAIKSFDKALEGSPDLYEAYFNRALAIEKTGDTAGAKKAWDDVLERTQDEEEVEELRAHIAEL